MAKVKNTVSPGWARFCGKLLRRMGWESVGGPMAEPKAIVLGVPHTSAKDFLVSYLFYAQYGKVAHIMIKKEFFFWPLGPVLRACGAVAVDRSNPTSLVRSLIHQMEGQEEFHLAIAPEGTRKAVKRWKTGFHLIARETGAAVYMGFFDWGTRRIGCGEKLELTDDVKADMARLYAHYRTLGLKGKNPDGYTVP